MENYQTNATQPVFTVDQRTPKRKTGRWLVIALVLLAIGTSTFFILQSRSETVAAEPVATIEIDNGNFSPQTIHIKKGQSVLWINKDQAAHQVMANPYPTGSQLPSLNSSEPLAEGDSYTATFEESGTYSYHDKLSPVELNGVVIVE